VFLCIDQFLGDIALTSEDVEMARQRNWRHQATDVGPTTTTMMPHVNAINTDQRKLPRRRHRSRYTCGKYSIFTAHSKGLSRIYIVILSLSFYKSWVSEFWRHWLPEKCYIWLEKLSRHSTCGLYQREERRIQTLHEMKWNVAVVCLL